MPQLLSYSTSHRSHSRPENPDIPDCAKYGQTLNSNCCQPASGNGYRMLSSARFSDTKTIFLSGKNPQQDLHLSSVPVQNFIQGLVGVLIALYPLHEVHHRLLHVAVGVVRAPQLHLLRAQSWTDAQDNRGIGSRPRNTPSKQDHRLAGSGSGKTGLVALDRCKVLPEQMS